MKNGYVHFHAKVFILLAWFFFFLIPQFLFAQWQYVKKIADSCTPVIYNNYSYYEWPVGTHGGGYSVTRNGTVVLSNSGSFGCCWVRALEPFTDSIVIFVEASSYPDRCMITKNEGNSWATIAQWLDIYIQDWTFVNEHSCYFISKGVYWDESRVSIRRVSDIRNRYLIENAIVDTLTSMVQLYDTVFGEPYCCEMDTIGFRILNDTNYINMYIYLTQVSVSVNENLPNPVVKIYPNPVHNQLIIEGEKGTKLILFDYVGRPIMEKQMLSEKINLDLTTLQPGIYFLNTTNTTNEYNIQKIIKL